MYEQHRFKEYPQEIVTTLHGLDFLVKTHFFTINESIVYIRMSTIKHGKIDNLKLKMNLNFCFSSIYFLRRLDYLILSNYILFARTYEFKI
jgi:hypothetical protein